MVPSVVSPTRQPHRDAEREQAVDQRLAELRLGRRVEVDVQRLRVHGEAGEEDVVRLGDRAAGLVLEVLARPRAPRTACRPWHPPRDARIEGRLSARARGRRPSSARTRALDVHPPEQALEVLARGLVESRAGRAAAVLDEQAAEAAVGGVPRGALDARVGGHAGEDELLHAPGPHQPLEARGVERAHRGLVEDGLAAARGASASRISCSRRPARVADRLRHRPHVGRQVAVVGQLRAHREEDHAQAARAESRRAGAGWWAPRTVSMRSKRSVALRLAPLVLQEPAQALVARAARVLHVHHHQRHPGRIELRSPD